METELQIGTTTLKAIKSDGNLLINDNKVEYSIKKLDENKFVIFLGHKSYEIERIHIDKKQFEFKLNQKIVSVEIKDALDKILERLGMDTAIESAINEVLAPMPGSIINIMVEEGAEVKKGDPLIILEAMKMENIIKSPADATISSINVKKGQNVDKNHPLVIF